MGLSKQPPPGPIVSFQAARNQRTWTAIFLVGIVGLVSLWVDLEISNFATSIKIPGDLRKAIHLSEAFAHFSGVVVILGALLLIDLNHRALLWRVCQFVTLSGVLANAAKYIIPRFRPHSLESAPFPIETSWDTWGVPWSESWFDGSLRSFPSGHSATAVALAIGLSYVYPRGSWVFILLATMACLQRLVSGAHFLSDIAAGVCIAFLTWLVYQPFVSCKASSVKTIE